MLRLTLEAQATAKFRDLSLESLRFHLLGDNPLTAALYEAILNNAIQVVFRCTDEPTRPTIVLTPAEALKPVGFGPDEGLYPYPAQSFIGYRLLTEFFAYPAKFLFFDLLGLARVCKAGYGRSMEVLIYLSRSSPTIEQGVEAGTFRLGCSPVVNLFDQVAEPIDLHHGRYEYRVVPDVAQPMGMEVYSVDEVTSTDPAAGVTTTYEPFYSFKHGGGRRDRRAFWYGSRRPSLAENDRGTDVYLNFVDLDFEPHRPSATTVLVRTTCSNRDLAGHLQRAGDQLHLELEAVAPLAGIRCVRTPTLPLRPPHRRGAHWRLLSHLNLNHLSITDPVEGKAALQEILRLYDFSDPASGQQMTEVNRQLIEGILAVSSRRVLGRVADAAAGGFCRGVEVAVHFDEEKYVGTGVYLFASMLERFIGLYASMNSFTQMVARTKAGEGMLKKWPPRAGEQVLA